MVVDDWGGERWGGFVCQDESSGSTAEIEWSSMLSFLSSECSSTDGFVMFGTRLGGTYPRRLSDDGQKGRPPPAQYRLVQRPAQDQGRQG